MNCDRLRWFDVRLHRYLVSLERVHEMGTNSHRQLISLSRLLTTSRMLHRQATRLPAAKPSRQNGHTLVRRCLLPVPVGALRCPMCGVLTHEDHKRLVSPLTNKLSYVVHEGPLSVGWNIDRALELASCAVLTPEVDHHALLFPYQVVHLAWIQVFHICDGCHSVGTVWWNVPAGCSSCGCGRCCGCDWWGGACNNLNAHWHLPGLMPQAALVQWLRLRLCIGSRWCM